MGFGCDLVEIHSVRVVSDRGIAGKKIYGSIQVHDRSGTIDMFKQEQDRPVTTSPDGTISLSGPHRCIFGPAFDLTLRLKERDGDVDFDVGKGYFTPPMSPIGKWDEKHVHAIFLGKDGYSVVHLTPYGFAKQANVEVALISNTRKNSRLSIYGRLIADSSKNNLPPGYDLKYSRTTLFDVPESKPMELQLGCGCREGEIKIPLSRYVVAAPSLSDLIIEADLSVLTDDDTSPTQIMRDTLYLEVPTTDDYEDDYYDDEEPNPTTEIIKGTDFHIEVTITWVDKQLREMYWSQVILCLSCMI